MAAWKYILFAAVAITSAECTLRLTSSSSTPTTITCHFIMESETNMIGLMSLTIAKRSSRDFQLSELITINAAEPDLVKSSDKFNGTVTGHVSTDGSWESYLKLELASPSIEDGGEYICFGQGYDDFNHIIRIESNLNVTFEHCHNEELEQKVKEMENQLSDARDEIASLKRELKLPILRELRDNVTTDVRYDPKVLRVSHVVGTSFYILTATSLTFETFLDVCRDNGGYPAEINTEDEYFSIAHTLDDMLKDNPEVKFVQLGVVYQPYYGPWVGFTHSEAHIYVGHWSGREVHDSIYEYTLHLWNLDAQWQMTYAFEYTNFSDEIGLCEVSLD